MKQDRIQNLEAAAEAIADSPGRLPKHMAEVADTLVAELECALPDFDPAIARKLSARLTLAIAKAFGGSSIYYPKADAIERAARNLLIWSEYDETRAGPNGVRALAKRYGLSENAIWRILRDQRELHREREQREGAR